MRPPVGPDSSCNQKLRVINRLAARQVDLLGIEIDPVNAALDEAKAMTSRHRSKWDADFGKATATGWYIDKPGLVDEARP